MKHSKEQVLKRGLKEVIPASDNLGAKFREWHRLLKEVPDFERAAAHNTEAIERHYGQMRHSIIRPR